MKYLLASLIFLSFHNVCYAQSEILNRYDLKASQQLRFQFDDANIIHILGWEENYISIIANINISNNQQNDAYQFEETNSGATKSIVGFIKNKNDLPKTIRIKKGDEIFSVDTDDWDSPEIQKFYADHGRDGIEWTSQGISWEINLQIKVPQRSDVSVTSKHGIIELENMLGKVEANSVHGGIDLMVNEKMKCVLDVKTKWGMIYSNLNLDIDEEHSSDKDWNNLIASINGGSGASIKLESRHANVYLRNK